MSWSLLAGTVVGVLLGLRHKVPAVLAASVPVAAVTGGHAYWRGHTGLALMGAIVLGVAALQAAYLATLAAQYAFRGSGRTSPLRKSRGG